MCNRLDLQTLRSQPVMPKKSPITSIGLLKIGFLACLTRMSGPRQPCISQSVIYKSMSHVQTSFHTLKESFLKEGSNPWLRPLGVTLRITNVNNDTNGPTLPY